MTGLWGLGFSRSLRVKSREASYPVAREFTRLHLNRPRLPSLNKIMKKAKKWKSIRIDEETYLKLKKNAEIREMAISQIINLLINK